MLALIFLSTIFFLNSEASLQASTVNYSFTVPGNSISLNFARVTLKPSIQPNQQVQPSPPVETEVESLNKEALSFVFELKSAEPLPDNLPLALLVYGDQVLFYVQASQLNSAPEEVLLDLRSLLSPDDEQQFAPVFYQNRSLSNFEFKVSELKWLARYQPNALAVATIENLTVIREKDQSITVIFSVLESNWRQSQYQLVCQNAEGEFSHAVPLLKKDDFLWPGLVFQSFSPNHKQELIFQLTDFTCSGLAYVADRENNRSNSTSIINFEDL